MTAPVGLEERLRLFREAFDDGFAVAPTRNVETFEDLLAIRAGGEPYALRVRDITGLMVSRKIVPLPSKRPELLGLAGHRGLLVAVYSLARLLGHGADPTTPSWLVFAGSSTPIGLGFGDLEGFRRVRAADLHAARPDEAGRPHVRQIVRTTEGARPVVDVRSTLAALAIHAASAGLPEES